MKAKLTRKSFFVDAADIRRAREELGVATDAEAVRSSVREIARMRTLARFMLRTAGSLPRGSFSKP
jgi:hypothetical protein